MKTVLRWLGWGAAGLAALLLAVLLGARLFTSTSGIARAIAWFQSDVDDYKRFPARVIENAPPTFYFKQPDAGLQQRLAPVFETVTVMRDGQPFTQGLTEYMEETDTMAFLVLRDDVLLYEGYFNGYNHNSIVTSFSTAKSFDSALVGLALADGYIGSLEDSVARYVPELLETDPRYEAINLRHLVSMSSGIHYEEHGLPWSDDALTYYSTDMRRLAVSSPIDGPPGREFLYNNFHPLLIGLVLERSTGRPVAEYLEEKIWKPLGMEAPASWSLDSERHGFEKMESGLNALAIDFAKFGRLYLNRGNWNGVQIIPEAWVDESTRLDTTTDPALHYQYFWWVNPDAPTHFYAAGRHGQFIYIVPEHDLVFVHYSRSDPRREWRMVFENLAGRLAEAGQ
jgi:CubicO group peptidase (beta-lactamase class C family)